MPPHKAELYCLKEKGERTNDFCSCNHCTLAVCRVCGAYEGGLTTHCPGVLISSDVQHLVSQSGLDYTDERGWFVWKEGEQSTGYKFEPTSKEILSRLLTLPFDEGGIAPATADLAQVYNEFWREFAQLRQDAKYWLEHPEGRR